MPAICVFFRCLESKSGYFLGFSKKIPTSIRITSTLRVPRGGGGGDFCGLIRLDFTTEIKMFVQFGGFCGKSLQNN